MDRLADRWCDVDTARALGADAGADLIRQAGADFFVPEGHAGLPY